MSRTLDPYIQSRQAPSVTAHYKQASLIAASGVKSCPRCEKLGRPHVKPLSEFYPAKKKGGKRVYCKLCCGEMVAESWRKNQDAYKLHRREKYAGEKQETLPGVVPPPPQKPSRPECGPRCACGAVLYAYEIPRGECLHCTQRKAHAYRNQIVRMTT